MRLLTRQIVFVIGLILFAASQRSSATVAGDEHWDAQFGLAGVTNFIAGIAINNGVVYGAGGSSTGFTNAPLYVWDGYQWSTPATFSGPSILTINDLAWLNNTLYAAGNFTNVNGVAASGLAKWDGTSWSSVGFTGTAITLAVNGNNLYVGGSFTNAGGVATTNIGYWDGSSWHGLGNGLGLAGGSSSVRAIALHNGQIYAGGIFTNSGSTFATNLAVWDGVNWTQIGGGMTNSGSVSALAFNGNDLYVGGYFSSAGTVAASSIAKWDGTSWSNLGGGLVGSPNATVASIAVWNGNVFVAGSFNTAGGTSAPDFAIWNGSSWSSAAGSMNASVNRVISTGTNLYVGGNFTLAGTVPVNGIAMWNGTAWSALGPPGRMNGLSSVAQAIAGDETYLYAGGGFSYAGQTNVGNLARFDGAHWSGMPGGTPNFSISSLAVFNHSLFVGSLLSPYFWANNGTNWFVPANDPVAGPVNSMVTDSTNLFMGGSFWFTDNANNAAFYSGRWDGTNWWSLCPSYNFTINSPPPPSGVGVNAVVVNGTNVFLGGRFVAQDSVTFPANTSCTNIVRWDGSRWRPLGTGVNSNIQAMVMLGTNLYVGGLFTNASGVAASRIAMWNGTSWSSLGSGVIGSGSVFALAALGTNLYAGGSFTNIGGQPINRIAKWDGNQWTSLGSGIPGKSGSVQSFFVMGANLYVGGNFRQAGDKNSSGIARWNEQINFDTPQLGTSYSAGDGTFHVRVSGIGGLTNIVQASTNLTAWVTVATNTAGIFDFTDPNATAYPYRYYRALLGP